MPITDDSGAVDQSAVKGCVSIEVSRYQYRVASNRCGIGKIGVVVQAATLLGSARTGPLRMTRAPGCASPRADA